VGSNQDARRKTSVKFGSGERSLAKQTPDQIRVIRARPFGHAGLVCRTPPRVYYREHRSTPGREGTSCISPPTICQSYRSVVEDAFALRVGGNRTSGRVEERRSGCSQARGTGMQKCLKSEDREMGGFYVCMRPDRHPLRRHLQHALRLATRESGSIDSDEATHTKCYRILNYSDVVARIRDPGLQTREPRSGARARSAPWPDIDVAVRAHSLQNNAELCVIPFTHCLEA
jgi:hypothetical protein